MWEKSLLLLVWLVVMIGLWAPIASAAADQPLYEKAESLYSDGELDEACLRFKEFLNLYPQAPAEIRHDAMEHMGIGLKI